jgi:putative ABC transport system permease protein
LAELHPETNEGYGATVRPLRRSFVPEVVETALAASLGAGLCVLLIICANVASLMLARATARRRETAIRAALGASRGRLIWQGIVEGLLLALPAGLAGVWLALLWQHVMSGWIPVDPPYLFTMTWSGRVSVYTLLVSVLAGLGCGLAPLLRGTAEGLVEALKEGGTVAGEGQAARWLRQALVAGELALSTALLVAALLMTKSFLATQESDRGYRSDGVVTTTLSLAEGGDARIAQAERLLSALRETPGLESVGLTSTLPVAGGYPTWDLLARGRSTAAEETIPAIIHAIAGEYRRTLDIPLLAGRDFDETEVREGASVALVSEGLARQLWGESDPLGRRLRPHDGDPESWLTVVGVVGGVDYGRDMVSSGSIPEGQVYVPYGRLPGGSLCVAALSLRPTAEVVSGLRAALGRGAPGVPCSEVLTLDAAIFRERWASAFFSRLLGCYAAAATLIAAVGLFGLTSETTSRRTRELAVRISLGAHRRTLIGMIVGEALRLGGLGVGLGLLLAAALSRFGAAMWHLVEAHDPVVFAGVATLLLGICVLAAALPAWRASGLDANIVLRCE